MKTESSRPYTWSDAELVRAARAGDVTSMGLLLHRHRPALYATALAILGHGQRAQDAVQDASLIALRRVHELREPAAFGGWLCAIGRNVSLMELRRSRRELLVAELPVATEGDALLAYEKGVERHALREWLWSALDDLPEAQRLVVMLRHFGRERCYEEIAEICAVPVGTVRSRLNTARHALAERLLEAVGSSDLINGREERWRSRLADVLDGINQGDRSPADLLLASDAVIVAGGRVGARDEVLPALLRDSDDGVRVRVGCVVAGAGVVVLDGEIENPPGDLLHCPPAFTWVGLHDESTISSLRFHHPRTRPAPAG
jgi:RNA polymerase sigma-70 factor, ECF subfamily